MQLHPHEWRIVGANALNLAVFGTLAIVRRNWEFLFYASVLIVAIVCIVRVQHRVRFSSRVLWGLTIWGVLHMAGGNIPIGDTVLYGVQLVPVVLRYDQFVHAFGFGVATLVCHHTLRPYLVDGVRSWGAPAIILVLAGAGLGAGNEIVEFAAVKTMPETNVGGYDNTMMDLIFNAIGAVLAMMLVIRRNRGSEARSASIDASQD